MELVDLPARAQTWSMTSSGGFTYPNVGASGSLQGDRTPILFKLLHGLFVEDELEGCL